MGYGEKQKGWGSSGNAKEPTGLAAAAGPSLGVLNPFAHLLFTESYRARSYN